MIIDVINLCYDISPHKTYPAVCVCYCTCENVSASTSCALHFHMVSWVIVALLQHIVIFPRGLCCSVVKVCMSLHCIQSWPRSSGVIVVARWSYVCCDVWEVVDLLFVCAPVACLWVYFILYLCVVCPEMLIGVFNFCLLCSFTCWVFVREVVWGFFKCRVNSNL